MTAAQKLHPLSVPYRIIQTAPSIILLVVFAGFAFGQFDPLFVVPLATLVIFAAIALVVGWQVAYYKRFEYELTRDTFDIRSGVISRRNREIPYRRIQNVDISRSLIQRAIGLAELRIETAGGGQSEAHLRYVGYDTAKHLQNEIRELTRGTPTDVKEADRQTATGRPLYEITDKDLGVLAIASLDLRVASLLVVILSFTAPSIIIDLLFAAPIDPLVIIAAIIIVVLVGSAILSGASAIINNYGFILTQIGDELRYERGLLQRYDGSIPLDKVQTLIVTENVLMRQLRYASLTLETAGYAPGQGGGESARAVPISKFDNTLDIAHKIEEFGDPSFTKPASQARIRYIWQYTLLLGVVAIIAFAVTWWFDIDVRWWVVLFLAPLIPVAGHLKWIHRGYAISDRYVLMRSGFWRRRTHIVPFYRIQTVDGVQSILQRRWGIATVVVDTAGSSGLISGDPTAYDLPTDVANELQDELSVQLQERLLARKRRDRMREIARPRTYQGPRGSW